MIVIDDCIRDLTRSKILSKTILNRRHCTYNKDEDESASLSLMITSQKYNLLPLSLRSNMSHVIVFKTTNSAELNAVKDEVMADLNKEQQNEILDLAWSKSHGFLFIDVFAPRDKRYFANFDQIEI